MKLKVDRIDLETKHRNRNCSTINFEHFKPSVRTAIIAVGRATFYEFDGRSYNAIYPPQPQLQDDDSDLRDQVEIVQVCAGCIQEKPLVSDGMCAECLAEAALL